MKIDAYCHIIPARYLERIELQAPAGQSRGIRQRSTAVPAMVDLDVRFRQLEEFGEDYRQVISIPAPPVEELGPPEVSRQFARVGNESLAELVDRYPEHFAGFVACMPMNDVDGTLEEIDYACEELGALGIQIYTHVNGLALDNDRFEPIWSRMAKLDKTIWVHPSRTSAWADYPTEERSKYELWWVFGWEYDTAIFMGRMVMSGVLERYPEIKFLIHHGGSMVPHFAGRIGPGLDQLGARTPPDQIEDVETYPLSKRPLDYFKQFYVDTALFGTAHAIRCSLEFFGADHVLFASDSPFDPEKGPGYIRSTIANLEELELSDADRAGIYEHNARRILGVDRAGEMAAGPGRDPLR
jgi:aminocarboxymuconate-semialdehyde decarboxylase